jgi:hypothetical protein
VKKDSTEMPFDNSTVRGCSELDKKWLYYVYRKEKTMFVVAVLICLLLFVALASADVLVSNINSDELSSMGVEKKS